MARVAVCALVVLCSVAVFGAGRGDWWMYQHDARHSGRSTVAGPPAPTRKWQFQTPSATANVRGPVFGSDGTIYFQSNEGNLYALNPNGTQKWMAHIGAPQFDLPPAPAVDANGAIYAIGNQAPTPGTPTPTCYFYTFDPSGTQKSAIRLGYNYVSIYATHTDNTWYDAGRSTSAPVISGNGAVYVGTQSGIYALTPNGNAATATATLIYNDYVKNKYYVTPGSLQQLVSYQGTNASPAVGTDGTLYYSPINNAGELCALAPDPLHPALTQKWIYPAKPNGTASLWSSPAIGADGTIYLGSVNGYLDAIAPTGTRKWSYVIGTEVDSTPAIAADGTIYVAANDGYLYAITAAGALKWKLSLADKTSAFRAAPAIGVDGTIYFGAGLRLSAISPTGTLKWAYPVGYLTNDSTPALGNDGTLYLGGTGFFTAFRGYNAIDVSSATGEVSDASYTRLKNAGIQLVIAGTAVNPTTGLGNTQQQLTHAQSAGLTTAAVCSLNLQRHLPVARVGDYLVNHALQAIGAGNLSKLAFVGLDVEPSSLCEAMTTSAECSALTATVAVLKQIGLPAVIATSRDGWRACTNNSYAFTGIPLWDSHYAGFTRDELADLLQDYEGAFKDRPYPPKSGTAIGWTTRIGKQFGNAAGTTAQFLMNLCQMGALDPDIFDLTQVQASGLKRAAIIPVLTLTPENATASSTVTGTVALSYASATAATLVTLSSDNPAIASVPSSVSVPAGKTSATFPVKVASTARDTLVSISATVNGLKLSAVLTVGNAIGSLTLAKNLFISTSSASTATIGTVTLTKPAPTGGIVVALSTDNSAVKLPSPATVTVPAGKSSVNFPLTIAPVGVYTAGVVTTTYNWIANAPIVVRPAGVRSLYYTPFSQVVGGNRLTGTVELEAPAVLQAITVTITSADPTLATVAPNAVTAPSASITLTIPVGKSTGTFVVATAKTIGSVDLTAQANGTSVSTPLSLVAARPDLLIRNAADSTFIGDHVFNQPTAQTKSQSVAVRVTAVYPFKAQNDSAGVDCLTLTAPAGGSGWSLRYFDALTGGHDITAQVAGTGWTTQFLASGSAQSCRLEVTPDNTIASGVAKTIVITGVSAGDGLTADTVQAVTTASISYQPDMSVCNAGESAYIGVGIFTTDGTNETKAQTVAVGSPISYLFRVQNLGNSTDTFTLKALATGSGWKAQYLNTATGADITTAIAGSGWSTGKLAPGALVNYSVRVTPLTASTSTSCTMQITTVSVGDATKKDVVKVVTTKK